MSTYKNYKKNWISPFYGVKPHKNVNDSFNDIVFSAELIIAKKELGELDDLDKYYFRRHLEYTDDEHGLYAPKNSHDNLTAKLAAVRALEWRSVEARMSLLNMVKKKHPRDVIIYGFLMGNVVVKYICLLLLPLALLDMVRAVYSIKVRPSWFSKKFFWFRLKAAIGALEFKERRSVKGGYHDWYCWEDAHDGVYNIIYQQNDGKILNLLRLNMFREYRYLKPIVRLFKMMYTRSMGSNFQTKLFENYFEEKNHPVVEAFRELDRRGKTVIDC